MAAVIVLHHALARHECEPLLRGSRELFDATNENGPVSVDYDTHIFAGRILQLIGWGERSESQQ